MLRNDFDYPSFVKKFANITHLISASICADSIKTIPKMTGTFWLEFRDKNNDNYFEWLGRRYIFWFHTVINDEQKRIIINFSRKFHDACNDEKCITAFKKALVGNLNNTKEGLLQANDKYLRYFVELAKVNPNYGNVVTTCLQECDSLSELAKAWYQYALIKPDNTVFFENGKKLLETMKVSVDLFEMATDKKFQEELIMEGSMDGKRIILENELKKMNALIKLKKLFDDAENNLSNGIKPRTIIANLSESIDENNADYIFKECKKESIVRLRENLNLLLSNMMFKLEIYCSIYGETKYSQASAAMPKFN